MCWSIFVLQFSLVSFVLFVLFVWSSPSFHLFEAEQQGGAGKGSESIFISAAEVPWQNVDDKGLQAKAFRNDPFRCVFRVPKACSTFLIVLRTT